ncbi:hypothetical protein DPMN_153401 [Dreissena polymorpha]|uniref:Uncharacterized protein n=1 Tax=Dreissena polymorpha TaxID=45954 RepID=A0A9D4FNT9_DREPO|nr:hypothetical protein DPMN_153401 [Dreissena polymorpha]
MNIGIGDNPLELKLRADNSLLFPNTSPGTRYFLDLEGEYLYPSSTNSQPAINEKLYSIELKWDGSATNGRCGLYLWHFLGKLCLLLVRKCFVRLVCAVGTG